MRLRARAVFVVLAFFGGVFSSGPAAAETTGVSNEKILQRLDAVEKKEDEIIQRLEEMKAELQIVKIRATLKG